MLLPRFRDKNKILSLYGNIMVLLLDNIEVFYFLCGMVEELQKTRLHLHV
jgi:hypothetical protein